MRRPLSKRKCKHCQTVLCSRPAQRRTPTLLRQARRADGQQNGQPASVGCTNPTTVITSASSPCRARPAVAQGPPGLLATPGLSGTRCVTR